MLAITRVTFKAVPLAWICSRLFCGDVNNLRVAAQVEPACSPFSFRIQNARLKWRLFLCKQTCHIPCKLGDNKKRSLFGWKWNSISVEFLRAVFVHQTKRLMIPLCFNYSTSPNWDFAQASGRPRPELTVCLITLYIPWLALLWDLSTWRSLLGQPCRDIDS